MPVLRQPSSSSPSREKRTRSDVTRARARVHLAHLSTQQIEDALRRCGGNLTQAAEKLNVGRTTLYLRTVEEPSLLETRAEIVE